MAESLELSQLRNQVSELQRNQTLVEEQNRRKEEKIAQLVGGIVIGWTSVLYSVSVSSCDESFER